MIKRRWSKKAPKKAGWFWMRGGHIPRGYKQKVKLFEFAGYVLYFGENGGSLQVCDMKGYSWKRASR